MKVHNNYLDKSKTAKKVVKNITSLASMFGAKVCVEGIETAGMRDILRHFHVESFQGYYYAKPLLPEAFMETMALRNGTDKEKGPQSAPVSGTDVSAVR